MAINLPVSAVGSPQAIVDAHIGMVPTNTSTPISNFRKLLAIYTGQLVFKHPENGYLVNLAEDDVFSFIPYADGRLQKFSPDLKPADYDIAATASLAAFEDRGFHDDTGDYAISAVNGIDVRLVKTGPNVTDPTVLVAKVQVASLRGFIYRVSYQVTVKIAPLDPAGNPNPGMVDFHLSKLNRWIPPTATTVAPSF